MKKLVSLLLAVSFLLTACGKAPTNIESSKISTDEFLSKLGVYLNKQSSIKGNTYSFEGPKEKYYDITTQEVADKIGCQIFKDGTWCKSFVYYQNKIYDISTWFGGLGIVDMQVCDFNDDGKPDILYTSSWGSGVHRWEIGLFDFTKMTDTRIYSSLGKTDMYDSDIILEPTLENNFNIYTITREKTEGTNFAKLKYSKSKLIGKIIDENKTPKIVFD